MKFKTRFFQKSFWRLSLFLLLLPSAVFAQGYQKPALLTGWQYRWGESPVGKDGIPLWVNDGENKNWKPYPISYKYPENPPGEKTIWIRAKIPQTRPQKLFLFDFNFMPHMEIFAGSRRIRKFGDQKALDQLDKKLLWPLIALPRYRTSKWVTYKVTSQPNYHFAPGGYIGGELNLFSLILTNEARRIIPGIIFVLIGLFSLFGMHSLANQRLLFSFSFLLICSGLFISTDNLTTRYLTNFSPTVWYFNGTSFMLVPFSLALFMESLFGPGSWSILKRARQITMLWTVLSITYGVIRGYDVTWYYFINTPLSILLFATAIIYFIYIIYVAVQGNTEARILAFGLISILVGRLIQSAMAFTVLFGISLEKPIEYKVYFPWEYFIALFTFVWIIRRRFVLAQNKLKDYSQNLEKKVEERSRELKNKNEKLGKTLQQVKQMQKQIITQEKMASLGLITTGVAHEIKNPLNFINNFSRISEGLIQEMKTKIISQKQNIPAEPGNNILKDLKELEEISHKTGEHGRRADDIVNKMLLHSQKSGGEFQKTDLNKLIEEYLALSYHAERTGDPAFSIKIVKNLEKLKKLKIDPINISQVLINLLNNAFYTVHEKSKKEIKNYKPEISISTKEFKNYVEIRINDNGTGIPEPAQSKIFNPFFTTKPPGSGTGLGLFICHNIITDEHKGKISFQSKEGEGTEFMIQLPK